MKLNPLTNENIIEEISNVQKDNHLSETNDTQQNEILLANNDSDIFGESLIETKEIFPDETIIDVTPERLQMLSSHISDVSENTTEIIQKYRNIVKKFPPDSSNKLILHPITSTRKKHLSTAKSTAQRNARFVEEFPLHNAEQDFETNEEIIPRDNERDVPNNVDDDDVTEDLENQEEKFLSESETFDDMERNLRLANPSPENLHIDGKESGNLTANETGKLIMSTDDDQNKATVNSQWNSVDMKGTNSTGDAVSNGTIKMGRTNSFLENVSEKRSYAHGTEDVTTENKQLEAAQLDEDNHGKLSPLMKTNSIQEWHEQDRDDSMFDITVIKKTLHHVNPEEIETAKGAKSIAKDEELRKFEEMKMSNKESPQENRFSQNEFKDDRRLSGKFSAGETVRDDSDPLPDDSEQKWNLRHDNSDARKGINELDLFRHLVRLNEPYPNTNHLPQMPFQEVIVDQATTSNYMDDSRPGSRLLTNAEGGAVEALPPAPNEEYREPKMVTTTQDWNEEMVEYPMTEDQSNAVPVIEDISNNFRDRKQPVEESDTDQNEVNRMKQYIYSFLREHDDVKDQKYDAEEQGDSSMQYDHPAGIDDFDYRLANKQLHLPSRWRNNRNKIRLRPYLLGRTMSPEWVQKRSIRKSRSKRRRRKPKRQKYLQ